MKPVKNCPAFTKPISYFKWTLLSTNLANLNPVNAFTHYAKILQIQADYLHAGPKHDLTATRQHCANRSILCSVSRGHSESAATSYREIYVSMLQKMLRKFSISSDTFSTTSIEIKFLLSHTYNMTEPANMCRFCTFHGRRD
jgi:hypothetical protein